MTVDQPAPPERDVHVNGVVLATQAFGDPGGPAILLIGGAEASMDWWDEEFTARLAAPGPRGRRQPLEGRRRGPGP